MSSREEKELRYLIYLKNEAIKQAKKELKDYRVQLADIQQKNYGRVRKKGSYHKKG